jgi:Putative transposase DNA-binding domain
MTRTLATRPDPAIEDLNVAGMVRNRKLARHVSDAAFGELRRQLEYKTGWYGTELILADRWFPSSKTCSACGAVKDDLTLSDRTYDCDACGLTIDRNLNAAINLARYHPAAPPSTRRRCVRPPDARTASAPGWAGKEPIATPRHEGALGRNRDKTRSQGAAGARTTTKHRHPGGQGKSVGPNRGTHPVIGRSTAPDLGRCRVWARAHRPRQ